jgi:hypothetical protein
MLPESSRMKRTLGGTLPVEALEIGVFEIGVRSAATGGGAATKMARVAPPTMRLVSIRRLVM